MPICLKLQQKPSLPAPTFVSVAVRESKTMHFYLNGGLFLQYYLLPGITTRYAANYP